MSKIIRYSDNSKERWSRVDLSDGTPLFISLAQTGIIVKKSKLGIFGPKLFKEDIIDRLARMCQNIDSNISYYSTPEGMKNPVLKVFTQVALDSSSPAEFITKLNLLSKNNLKKNVNFSLDNSNGDKLKYSYEIVNKYGKVLEETSQMVYGAPLSKLPNDILDIQEAILEVAFANKENDDVIQNLRTGFMMLGTFIKDEIALKNDKIRKIVQDSEKGLSNEDLTHIITEMDFELQMQEEIKKAMDKNLFVFDESFKKIIKHRGNNLK